MPGLFECRIDGCNKSFTRKYSLNQHQRTHQNHFPVERCLLCGQIFNNCDEIQQHYANSHPPSRRFVVRDSAFRRKFITYRYNYLPNQNDFIGAQKSIKNLIMRQILNEAAQKLITRVALIFIAEMVAEDHSGERVQNAVISFRAPTFYANASNPRQIERMVRQSFTSQLAHLDEFMRSGSNWRFNRALAFDIELSAVNPIRGGCNLSTWKWKNPKHLYSPKNTDNKCFLYCIAYFLLYGLLANKTEPTAIELERKIRKRVKNFEIKGLQFPLDVQDIGKFLRRNPMLDISINVLYRDVGDDIYPLEYRLGTGQHVVTLLLVNTSSGGHYMLVKNPDMYLRKVYNNGISKIRYKNAYFCLNCMSSFSSKDVRNKHEQICMANKPRREETPSPELGRHIVRFRRHERKHWLDYIAYLDFECILPNTKDVCKNCSSLKCKCDNISATRIINNQIPICYSFVVLDSHDNIIHEHTYIGPDAHLDFMAHLLKQEEEWMEDLLTVKRPLQMTFKDTTIFNNTTECYMCLRFFTPDIVKCRDHDHFTGEFIGAACQRCNLRRVQENNLKIFIHNASKYDMHFLIQAIPKFKDKIRHTRVLPYNGENFRTMTINRFEILDSLSFLQASLSQLANDLKTSKHSYNILKQTYLVREKGSFNRKRLEMVLAKSFFPYEYCTSYEKMLNTKKLPKISKFYSKLTEKSITKEEHIFAKKVWLKYGCKNLLDYCKLYCKIDVILLAEIFQKFRKEMMAFSGLDPAHYISLPAYGYDSMLLMTGAKIFLPLDIDMVHFMEKCKRGGVSFVNTRYLNANVEEKEEEEKKKETERKREEIFYIDANNLYGWSQVQKLPTGGFRWLTREETQMFDVFQDIDGEIGYFVECDLHYPSHLHESHSNFPLAPEILEIDFENLSPYAKTAIAKSNGEKRYSDVKLMSTFHDKINYVLHIRNLQLYLSLGLKLMKIHRVLEFKQEHLLRPYIEKTTLARQKAASKFESDQFKKLVSQNNFKFYYEVIYRIQCIRLQ